MNKQEALVAILEKCRTYEQPHEEVRRAEPAKVLDSLLGAAGALEEDPEDGQASLLTVAACALYLLVDEVEIVAGRTLEQWLADKKLTGYTLPVGVQPGPGVL